MHFIIATPMFVSSYLPLRTRPLNIVCLFFYLLLRCISVTSYFKSIPDFVDDVAFDEVLVSDNATSIKVEIFQLACFLFFLPSCFSIFHFTFYIVAARVAANLKKNNSIATKNGRGRNS